LLRHLREGPGTPPRFAHFAAGFSASLTFSCPVREGSGGERGTRLVRCAAAVSRVATAQTYPARPVRMSDPVAQGFVASLTKPGQSYRFQLLRVLDRRQMARPAQRDCARPRSRRRHVQC
jgi:hypothetical protein